MYIIYCCAHVAAVSGRFYLFTIIIIIFPIIYFYGRHTQFAYDDNDNNNCIQFARTHKSVEPGGVVRAASAWETSDTSNPTRADDDCGGALCTRTYIIDVYRYIFYILHILYNIIYVLNSRPVVALQPSPAVSLASTQSKKKKSTTIYYYNTKVNIYRCLRVTSIIYLTLT